MFVRRLDAPLISASSIPTGRTLMPHAQKTPSASLSLAPLSTIESVFHHLRGERVILDADLAKLYGVTTKAFNQAVRRNLEKFPPDFLITLTPIETEQVMRLRSQFVTTARKGSAAMRSQIVTASKRNLRHLPFAFTEHGEIMVPISRTAHKRCKCPSS